jgi:hypothetical protein
MKAMTFHHTCKAFAFRCADYVDSLTWLKLLHGEYLADFVARSLSGAKFAQVTDRGDTF